MKKVQKAKPAEYDYDVFISYSSHDKEWVQGELLKRLERAGLKPIIFFRDFKRGAPTVTEIERAVLNSRKTLLVLSPEYFDSQWCVSEMNQALTVEPANVGLRVIPLFKTESELPLRIQALTGIDFTEHADTELAWRQLLTALGAPPEPEPPKTPERRVWFLAHPYPMPPNFTGRFAEREMLTQWLTKDAEHPLLVIRALGGFGKSALTWHWLTHDISQEAWPNVVWWSFYEGDASFDNFLGQTLTYLSDGRIPPEQRSGKNAVNLLLQALHHPGTLLVLDGFERALRAFSGLEAAYQGDEARKDDKDRDCVSPLAEHFLYNVALQPNLRSKVLLTTRLTPRILEAKGGSLLQGCRERELRQLEPADAVAFFQAQGIRGTRAEIEGACAPYGYHPLSLSLLAGLIVGDFQQPGDIATARRLDVSGDLVQRQHHVLETAYDRLAPERQLLLARIACFRSPVRYEALRALAQAAVGADKVSRKHTPKSQKARSANSLTTANLDGDLRDLVARGLLHHDLNEGRFDLHPIVRRYAYDRLAASDRAVTHARLRDYFAAVPGADKVIRLDDLAPVIELYHHTIRAGQYDEAIKLFQNRLWSPLYYQLGAYQLAVDLLTLLFPDGENLLPRLESKRDQSWTLNALANSYSVSGQPKRAVGLLEQAIAIDEETKDERNLAIGWLNLVLAAQVQIGKLRSSEENLRLSLKLSRKVGDEVNEAIARRELGRLLLYTGSYEAAKTEFATVLEKADQEIHTQKQSIIWGYQALLQLVQMRSLHETGMCGSGGVKSDREIRIQASIEAARQALKFNDETARTSYSHPRENVRARRLLGVAQNVAGQYEDAQHNLHEALEICRRINLSEFEADILVDLTRLHVDTGVPDEAQRTAEEALMITERCGYVLQGADAHLELAKLALARGDRAVAKEHAQNARELATCDGPPDYTYKVAYDEAGALLEELGP